MEKTIIFFVIIMTILFLSFNAWASDRYVAESGSDSSNDCTNSASPCGTIDHAVNSASSGDTVKVAQGTYYENININNSGLNPLTIQGGWNQGFTVQNEDPSITEINGGGTDRVLYIFNSNAFTDLTIEGFKITNGGNVSSGGGIYVNSSGQITYITLTNNIIINNSSSSSGGGIAINVSSNGSITFNAEKNRITNNEAGPGNGAGIAIWNGNESATAHVTLKNNIIADNGKTSNAFGLYSMAYGGICNVDLINNTITNNGNSPGGGVKVLSSGDMLTYSVLNSTNNIIWGNSTADIFIQPWDADSAAIVNTKYSDIGTLTLGGIGGGTGEYNDNGNNIDADPLFRNVPTGNYHLKSASPCRGNGLYDKQVWIGTGWIAYDFGVPALDFEGDSRDSNWIETSTDVFYKYCDIGADEYTPNFNPSILLLLSLN